MILISNLKRIQRGEFTPNDYRANNHLTTPHHTVPYHTAKAGGHPSVTVEATRHPKYTAEDRYRQNVTE